MSDGQKNLFHAPEWTEIAKAAREAIRAVKADFPEVEDIHLAALIHADCAKTIERLERMETKKVPASLFAGIGRVYGAQYIKTYRDLMMAPESREAINALPAITALAAKLAAAVQSGGGVNHTALPGMMSDLRQVAGIVAALQTRASDLGIAA